MVKYRISLVIIIALFLVYSFAMLVQPVSALDEMGDIENTLNEDTVTNIEIKPILSGNNININETASVIFESNIDVVYDRMITDGIEVDIIDASSLEFQIEAEEDGFGQFDLVVETVDGLEIQSSIYTYKYQDILYLSEISHEVAWYYSKEASLSMDPTLANLYEDEYSVLFASDIEYDIEKNIIYNENVTTFTGVVEWETSNKIDYTTGQIPKLPFRRAKIEIRKKNAIGSQIIATTYTNDDGIYVIQVPNDNLNDGQNFFVRVWLDAKTYQLRMDWQLAHYYFDTDIQNNLSIGNTYTVNCNIQYKNSLSYKAACVHQSMGIAERFADTLGFSTNNKIRVAYPAYGTIWIYKIEEGWQEYTLKNMAFCWGDINDNCLAAIGKESYNNTQMIVHEYSHYIQCSLGNYGEPLWEILLENPNHDGEGDYYSQKGDKSFAMHLSWTEGWGYAFSIMAQRYYANEYAPLWGDNYITDILNYSDSEYIGEFQERSVNAFLWSLVDKMKITSNAAGAGDYKLPWTPQEWWDMTTVSGTCRLPDFINLIENESYNLGVDIDYKQIKEFVAEKLTTYNIAPKILNAYKDTYNDSFVIVYEPNGSSSYPNNRFVVKIYNENKEKIYESEEDIRDVSNTTNCFYLIDMSDWNDIVSSVYCGQTIYISVEGYRYDENADDNVKKSGPYYSQYFAFTINGDHNYSCEMVDSNTHTRTCETCSFETTVEHDYNYSKYSSVTHYTECSSCNYRGEKNHRYQEIDVNDTSHNLKCQDCGYINKFNHRFTYTPFGSTHHYAKCQDCSYTDYREHSMQYATEDGIHYRNYCQVCGYSNGEELHTWVYTSINSLYHEGHCADCGEIKVSQESHSWKVASNPQYVECQYCGHLKLKPTGGGGGIIPVQPFKEDEIEEETE